MKIGDFVTIPGTYVPLEVVDIHTDAVLCKGLVAKRIQRFTESELIPWAGTIYKVK